MLIKNLLPKRLFFCLLLTFIINACQTSSRSAGTTNGANAGGKQLAPQRVDIRGTIILRRYNQGQVVLEVEGFPSQYNRYNRAYVLVLPITQIIGPDGKSFGMSELQMGQQVAVLLRSGGRGNLEGIGVARKMWVEDAL